MKLFCFTLLFSLGFFNLAAGQQNRFLYLQTENAQPFYVRLNNTVYSSSNSGYVIIPRLKDGRYEFTIGFPRNEWPLQKVEYTVDKKDAGFILKNFGEKGWGLFNLQTLDVIMANGGEVKKDAPAVDDSFAGTLSQVVGADLSTPETPNEKPVAVAEKTEDPVKIEDIKVTDVGKVVVEQEEEPVIARIEKVLSTASSEGLDIVYIDRGGARPDTIRIFIPADKPTLAVLPEEKKGEVNSPEPLNKTEQVKVEEKEEVTTRPKAEEETTKTKASRKRKDKKQVPAFIEMELPVTDTATRVQDNNVVAAPVPDNKVVIPNSNCKTNAEDKDFLKLRKNMASRKSPEDMVAVARRDFRSRCYSVDQVKHLSALFLDDASKYMFFDAAYPSVHDFANFPTLISELKDPYFITRFEAMIRK